MEESMRYKLLLKTLALGLSVLVATALSVAAQTTSGSLSGTVKDAHGAAISGASIQVTSTNRNETPTTQTGEDGSYVFPHLQPDTYKLRIRGNGSNRRDLEGVAINATKKICAPV